MTIDRNKINELNCSLKILMSHYLDAYNADGLKITISVARQIKDIKIEVSDYMKV